MAEFDVDALRALLAQADEDKQPEAPSVPDVTEVPPAQVETPEVPTEPEQPAQPATPVEPQVATQADKDANAFAQMRAQNKLMSDMLAKMAKANGVEYNDMDDLLAKFNDDAIGKLAAQQGVPKELLARMESLERDANLYRAQQNENRLVGQMRNIMSEFELSPEELTQFANDVDASGVDLNTVNLRAEYLNRNMDKIIEKRVTAAVQAALRGDAEINAQSTQPGKPGEPSGNQTGTRIETVADLRSILANAGI